MSENVLACNKKGHGGCQVLPNGSKASNSQKLFYKKTEIERERGKKGKDL